MLIYCLNAQAALAPRTQKAMTGKTVLITGSTRGIGLEFAQHYAKAGWRVIGVARNGSNADKVRFVNSALCSILGAHGLVVVMTAQGAEPIQDRGDRFPRRRERGTGRQGA